jgi:hypothetical protein
LDKFEVKVVPHFLQLFSENLNHKLKNAKYNVGMSSHRKHLSGDHWKTSTARETTSGFKKKDSI